MPKEIALQVGQMYRVHYTQELAKGKISHWIATVKYLGPGMRDELDFSLRPKAGTSSLNRKQIVSVAPLSPKAVPVLPRRMSKDEVSP